MGVAGLGARSMTGGTGHPSRGPETLSLCFGLYATSLSTDEVPNNPHTGLGQFSRVHAWARQQYTTCLHRKCLASVAVSFSHFGPDNARKFPGHVTAYASVADNHSDSRRVYTDVLL